RGVNIPKTGQSGNVGVVVTKTLVIAGDPIITTTPEHPRGAMLRAYDKNTGKEVGAVWMPAQQSGSPMTYMIDGKQYIVIAARGELKLPDTLPRSFNGIWGSLNQRATEPKAEMRNCILVVDGSGNLIESWAQWDKLFEGGGGPHKIRINPYDPARHVWV